MNPQRHMTSASRIARRERTATGTSRRGKRVRAAQPSMSANVLLLFAASATAEERAADFDYAALYNGLYENTPYHHSLRYSHGDALTHAITHGMVYSSGEVATWNNTIHSVLDVGCSHGMAVERLWKLGLNASGMDVAAAAIEMAQRYRRVGRKCVDPCFRQGSALKIPWPAASFDAIMTTDVLEHLRVEDVPTVVSEFSRVSRRWVFAVISSKPGGSADLDSLRASVAKGNVSSSVALSDALKLTKHGLHLSVQDQGFWARAFRNGGFRIEFSKSAYQHTFVLELVSAHEAGGSRDAPAASSADGASMGARV